MWLILTKALEIRAIQNSLLNKLFLALFLFLLSGSFFDELFVLSKFFFCISDEKRFALVYENDHITSKVSKFWVLLIPVHQLVNKIIKVLSLIVSHLHFYLLNRLDVDLIIWLIEIIWIDFYFTVIRLLWTWLDYSYWLFNRNYLNFFVLRLP